MTDEEKKQIIEQVLTEVKNFIFKYDTDNRSIVYKDDFEKFVKKIKRENGMLPTYQTLREYIDENENGAYSSFKFDIGNWVHVYVSSTWEFEEYYQPHLLDDYVVVKDDATDNNGDCETYKCIHKLTIEKKENQ